MRKTCQPKNNVADGKLNTINITISVQQTIFIAINRKLKHKSVSEKIDKMSEGVFIEEKEVMCYVACIMKMANAVRLIFQY